MLKVRMVKGPATVTVHGSCHVLGRDVSDQTISVRAGKILPFELTRGCRLYVKLENGGKMWIADPSTAGTAMWRGVVHRIFALAKDHPHNNKTITVMLVGDADTGKSTLSTFLVNRALAYGMIPCVIDGDIGQGDLAPPSAIGAATLSKQIVDLRDVSANLFEFVGDKSPAGIEQFVIEKLKSILEKSIQIGKGNIVIINTDGYVRDSGATYKVHMAEVLRPDMIVCLGANLPLFDRLKKSGRWRVLRAPASSQAYKSRMDRIGRRLDQYLRHIGEGEEIISIEQIKFVYMGKILSSQDVLHSPASISITIPQLEPSNMEGMFVGLGSENEIAGFGIIASVINGDLLCVKTDVQNFDRVHLSNIRLDKDKTAEIKLQEMQGPEDQAK